MSRAQEEALTGQISTSVHLRYSFIDIQGLFELYVLHHKNPPFA